MSRSNFRWFIIGLLFFITFINFLDRASISFAMQSISRDFSFNVQQQGIILGAFGLGCCITNFLGGIAVDRYGARGVLFFSVLLWSLATLLNGFAIGFLSIYIARVLLGVAEGPNFPALTRVVSDWLPPTERAKALANSLVSVPIALGIGAPIVTELILALSWRGMFIILGVIGLLWMPFWWCFFHNFPQDSSHVNEQELAYIHDRASGEQIDKIQHDEMTIQSHRRQQKNTWVFLFTNPTLLANNWSFFVFGYFLFFFMTWLPSYLEIQHGLNLRQVGFFTLVPWLVSALFLIIVGHASDKILAKTKSLRLARSYPIWISQLCAALCVLPIVMEKDSGLIWDIVFITLAVSFSMSANAAYYVTNIDVAKRRAGSSIGIMDVGFALSGVMAPILTGYLVSETGSFEAGFWILSLLGLSSVLVVLLFHHPDRAEKLQDIHP